MLITPFRAFLFVAAAVVVAAGTAYCAGAFDVRLGGATYDVAAQEADSTPGKDSRVAAKTQDQSGANAPAEGASGEVGANGGKADASKAASDEEADKLVVPTFDVVRVEPDGSMVVAGSAAPGSDVEIVSGATIVGKAKAGPEGDFAVALDDPLEPGDYQLVLRATSPDHIVATSKETAVVSIPDNPQGQVLALVEEPGEPSRLITVPKAQEPSDDIATVAPEDEQKAPVAGAGSDDGRQTPDAAAAPKGEAPSMASGSEAAGKSADSKQATKPTTGEGEGTDVATGGGQAERTASQAEESGGAPEDAAEKTARTARNSGTAAETGGAAAPAGAGCRWRRNRQCSGDSRGGAAARTTGGSRPFGQRSRAGAADRFRFAVPGRLRLPARGRFCLAAQRLHRGRRDRRRQGLRGRQFLRARNAGARVRQ